MWCSFTKKIGVFINLKKDKLNDPNNICADVSPKGHWGNGDYLLFIISDEDVDYCMTLIE